MPLKGARYRVKQTSKGPIRLAFRGNRVIETKSLATGKVHTPGEFANERKARAKRILSKR